MILALSVVCLRYRAKDVSNLKRQQGIAVITALLIVALGTISVVAIVARQQFDMQREQNEGLIQMARDFAISGERFAVAMLYRDRKDGMRNNSDSLDDDWAQTIPPVPIDNASIKGCIVDFHPEWLEKEGILPAIIIMVLPLVILFVLSKIFPFWQEDDPVTSNKTAG